MGDTLTPSEKEQYRREGYVILRGIIPPEEVEALKADVRELAERSAAAQGPEIRWINQEKRIPERLGQLLRPDWIRPSFIASLATGPYLPVGEQLLGAPLRY